MKQRRTVIHHGPTGAGPAVQRAAVTGVLTKPADDGSLAGDENPSDAPVFAPPFTGVGFAEIDLNAYTGTIYLNPQGGMVNPPTAIVWAPAP